eukprot:SAG11_NODE_812_length_7059_cov_5.203017_6_plen_81_part_00
MRGTLELGHFDSILDDFIAAEDKELAQAKQVQRLSSVVLCCELSDTRFSTRTPLLSISQVTKSKAGASYIAAAPLCIVYR